MSNMPALMHILQSHSVFVQVFTY